MEVGRSQVLSPGQYLGSSIATAGTGGTLGTEGTGHVSPVAIVTTSAPSANERPETCQGKGSIFTSGLLFTEVSRLTDWDAALGLGANC